MNQEKLKEMIEDIRKVADNYQKEGGKDRVTPNMYMLGKADGLRTVADKLMSLLS